MFIRGGWICTSTQRQEVRYGLPGQESIHLYFIEKAFDHFDRLFESSADVMMVFGREWTVGEMGTIAAAADQLICIELMIVHNSQRVDGI